MLCPGSYELMQAWAVQNLGPPVCSNTQRLYCTFFFGNSLERFLVRELIFSKNYTECTISAKWQKEVSKLALVSTVCLMHGTISFFCSNLHIFFSSAKYFSNMLENSQT